LDAASRATVTSLTSEKGLEGHVTTAVANVLAHGLGAPANIAIAPEDSGGLRSLEAVMAEQKQYGYVAERTNTYTHYDLGCDPRGKNGHRADIDHFPWQLN